MADTISQVFLTERDASPVGWIRSESLTSSSSPIIFMMGFYWLFSTFKVLFILTLSITLFYFYKKRIIGNESFEKREKTLPRFYWFIEPDRAIQMPTCVLLLPTLDSCWQFATAFSRFRGVRYDFWVVRYKGFGTNITLTKLELVYKVRKAWLA